MILAGIKHKVTSDMMPFLS